MTGLSTVNLLAALLLVFVSGGCFGAASAALVHRAADAWRDEKLRREVAEQKAEIIRLRHHVASIIGKEKSS